MQLFIPYRVMILSTFNIKQCMDSLFLYASESNLKFCNFHVKYLEMLFYKTICLDSCSIFSNFVK